MAKWITVTPNPLHAQPRIVCPHRRTVPWLTPSGNQVRCCPDCGEIVNRTPSEMMITRGKQPKSHSRKY